MKFEKGQSGNPAGKPKGALNKSTLKAREAIGSLIDGNSEHIQKWLNEIYAEKGALAALDAFTSLLEFHVPKLARTELAGDKDSPVTHNVTVKFE